MRYSENIDYLFASIMYLGTHNFWWARSSRAMASELQLEQQRLQDVFDGFPGIFRRSLRTAPDGLHFYALQARYAQREGGDVRDPDQHSYIAPLPPDKLQVIINFILKMAEQEAKADDQKLTRRQHLIAIGTAIVGALALLATAIIKGR